MRDNFFQHSANRLEAHLGKDSHEFTKDDIKQVVSDLNIRMINFMYPAGDGRLKTLNFMLHTPDYLETILTSGERVDGSLRPLSTLSQRFQHFACSARSSIEMVIR